MKLYIANATREEKAEIEDICQQRGWELQALSGTLGRVPQEKPVKKVLNAYRRLGKVRPVARELGVNPGTVHRILRDHGYLSNTKGN